MISFTQVLRGMWRNKVTSIINIVGLAIGLTCSFLIVMWVADEISFDQFHSRKDLYRLLNQQHYAGGSTSIFSATPGLLADALKAELPEMQYASTAITWMKPLIRAGDLKGNEKAVYAQPDFAQLFSFPVLSGDLARSLASPTSVAITEKLALKYFSTRNALGRQLLIDKYPVSVGAVLKDVPENSSLQFDCLYSFEVYQKENHWLSSWGSNGPSTFISLKPNTDTARLSAKLFSFIKKHKSDTNSELHLQRFKDAYLHGTGEKNAKISTIRLFEIIVVLLVLIASINFMNLTTASLSKRGKEIGIRKVLGAAKKNLISSLLSESVFTALLAGVLALVLSYLLLPQFRLITGKTISFPFNDLRFWIVFLLGILLTGILAGSYPAILFSSINPLRILKGKIQLSALNLLIRKGLVIFQFVISIGLITSSFFIWKQINLVLSKDIGLEKQNLLEIVIAGKISKGNALRSLIENIRLLPVVSSATAATSDFISNGSSTGDFDWPGKTANEMFLIDEMWVESDILKTVGSKLLLGRDFVPTHGVDSNSIILNETAAQIMNLKSPLGAQIRRGRRPFTVIGVAKDFNYNNLHSKIGSLALIMNDEVDKSALLVRLAPGSVVKALGDIERIWQKHNAEYPFEYHFFGDTYDKSYKSEITLGKLSGYFALVAILISCLGLFGLSVFSADQRTKEIGVRKVVGASKGQIVRLLSLDFLRLVAIANIIAWPLTYLFVRHWLENFSNRTPLTPLIFLLAGLCAFAVAFITTASKAWSAASANPVVSLRSE